ncbi:hypothetical protein NEOLEDRAFT_1171781 [Neolentinus lepideus HHB14362 ss-1]|uniref:Uncharacterized protein n=1 Tax=Neolentinus lepideus HHB14362 ss-1 TaxID=1314782 RepID=A0A165Q1A2_9AGAM|nr:hypothetical protein NEOLEDRAFT_1171781 [Neolentinus lepideus HHB14362 ss-1]
MSEPMQTRGMNTSLYESSSFTSSGLDQTESVSRALGALYERPVDIAVEREGNPSVEAREHLDGTLDPSSQVMAESVQGKMRAGENKSDVSPRTEASSRAVQTGVSRAAALDDLRDEIGMIGGQTSTVKPQSRV